MNAENDSDSSTPDSPSPSTDASPERPIAPVTRGRRGRGRGCERGVRRGRRRGAGVVYGPRPPTAAERAELLREQRDAQLQDRISQLNERNLRELVMEMCNSHPNYVLEVTNRLTGQANIQGFHPDPDSPQPEWCICRHCREMPTETERQCCRQIPDNCFSVLPDFRLYVVHQPLLALAQRYRQDVLAAGDDPDVNRGNRHAAYRQFILWQHGYLGAGNRRVIPSCCVWKIRD